MPRGPAEPPIQSSIIFAEAPVWPNDLVQMGSISRNTSMVNIHSILWAFGSTAAANYGISVLPDCQKICV